MPINPAVIAGAFGLGADILTNIGTKKRESDKRFYDYQMEHSRRKYDQAMWDKVNKYNHPLQQMERLVQAGLNPNLIYGSSPGSAVGNAQSIASGKQLQGQAPQYQINNPMTPFMDTKVKQAQANNLNTSAIKNISGANLNNAQKNRLNDLLASEVTMYGEQAKQSKTKTFMDALRKEASTLPGKGLIAEQMLKVETAIENKNKVELENSVLKLKSDLAKRGIRETDPLTVRLGATILGLDLSKPLTTDQAKDILDFLKDPWDKITDIINNYNK